MNYQSFKESPEGQAQILANKDKRKSSGGGDRTPKKNIKEILVQREKV